MGEAGCKGGIGGCGPAPVAAPWTDDDVVSMSSRDCPSCRSGVEEVVESVWRDETLVSGSDGDEAVPVVLAAAYNVMACSSCEA